MSDAPAQPPRRIPPVAGPFVWQPAELSPAAWMIPVGAEHAAELAAGSTEPTRLRTLLRDVAGRCNHGLGFALLRGLAPEPAVMGTLAPLIEARPLPVAAGQWPVADLAVLQAAQASRLSLASAGAIHNRTLREAPAALAELLQTAAGAAAPVFARSSTQFAGLADPAATGIAGKPELQARLDPAELALGLPLRPGDLLFWNPLLVWIASGEAPGPLLAFRTEPSRLADALSVVLEDG